MPADVPYEPLLPDGMQVPAQVLDEERLTGCHDWGLLPSFNLQFRENVEMIHHPRPDIDRFKLIAQSNRTIARNLFSVLCRSTTLFKIPNTINCSRTYARDAEEAYYLDAMDAYLKSPPSELDVRDLPLLKSSLKNRMFCGFNRKAGYRSELFERRRVKQWLPSDVPENRHFDDAALVGSYPKTEAWVDDIYQPPALAVPLQFSVYYFHKELRDAQLCNLHVEFERSRRLRFCVRKEHYIFIMAMWWNDVYYGGRMYVLETSTINILESECGTVEDIAGMPAQALIAHMRIVARFPSIHHNWMIFNDDCMEPSTFVWSIKGTGGLDDSRPAGLRFFCSKADRKVSTSKYGSAMLRRSSIMEERISIPELDRIEGLLALIQERGWQAHGSMRVGELAHHLLGLYRHTHSLVGDVRRNLEHAREDLVHKSKAFEDLRMDLEDAHNRLRDAENAQNRLRDAEDRISRWDARLDYLESVLRDEEQRVSDLKQCIDNQSRELRCLRSKNTLRSVERSQTLPLPVPGQYSIVPRSPHYTPHSPVMNQTSLEKIISSAPASLSRSQAVGPSSYPGYRSGYVGASRADTPSTPAKIDTPSTPAQAASPGRPKRGYPFYEIPASARKRMNRDEVPDSPRTGAEKEGGSSEHA